ncbi:MBL fold metallo-hydrolase [Phenylobacterium sp.]|uniref:MBL fold metallo-hydrolase n=1 Tax=Phenylobacterium sp. TaxID=1871053 RepID=UPI0012163B47|nr:MBL fold metallo-hydrolase [Phenylobacterium sp.]THD59882.1 MAG: MBL fold metallo-hydrolase [Phenylobacterium sp.]
MINRRFALLAGLAAAAPGPILAAAKPPQGVILTYLGNAGWRIEDGRTVVIVDPFLSQFHLPRAFYRSASEDDGTDDVLVPDEAQIDAHVPRADFVLVTHAHQDHMLDVPTVAKHTGATVIGSEGAGKIARAEGVPEKQLIIVKGGEDLEFGAFSLRVIPSLHSELAGKHYNNSPFAGPVADDLKPPLRESAYHEGGTFAYLLRIAGHQVLIMGGMNFIEREMEGLRPDIALIGAGASHREVHDYAGRLMRALGDPPAVFPTHWDSYANMTAEAARHGADLFAAEIKAASPRTRVIIPAYFEPMTFGASGSGRAKAPGG